MAVLISFKLSFVLLYTNNEFITEQLQLTHSEGVEVIFDPETGLPIRSHAADSTTTTNSHTNMNDYKGANIKKQKFDFPSKPKEKSRDELVKIWAERLPRANIMFISAQYELGVNELRQWLVQVGKTMMTFLLWRIHMSIKRCFAFASIAVSQWAPLC